MKKLVLISLLAALFTAETTAQNEIDALRYSRLNYSGTARFVSMGGAFGALGADFTTLSHNPAGLGLYRRSEITFTPAIGLIRTEALLDGNFREDSKYNFNIGSVGFVKTNDNVSRNGSGWKNVQFGFGFNRMANFNNRVRIEGDNFNSSILTGYMESAQGVHPEDLGTFDTRLAYDTELLFVTDSSTWTYGVDKPDGGVNQRKSIDSKGSINEMVISIGANYNDKVYLGATVGFPYLRYRENATYTETALPDDETVFNSMTRSDFLETRGTGINFKFGFIFRATDWLRLGGAIHTPSFYISMTDEYRSTIRAKYDNGFNPSASANGVYEYELTTPLRAIGSVGFIVGKHGVISADYEFVDYSTARLLAPDYDFYDENEAIRSMYQQANNFRFGTEWRYGALNFRGGYAISANPYNVGTNSAMSTYSAGIGIREKVFYIDLAWVGSQFDDEYYLYNGLVEAAKTTTFNNTFMVTLGIKY